MADQKRSRSKLEELYKDYFGEPDIDDHPKSLRQPSPNKLVPNVTTGNTNQSSRVQKRIAEKLDA